ncbi:hypothetical protein JNB_12888 [Janibacter sp. HTCC2649]|uniref:ATP-binding protein n=1 Tax=Janibacter sp. HTCC2649 TaxID=313589 RepID=UPI0000671917|nr:ATP-binding protein [Janibacter sp. HTCC2649]EAP97860.1 hypothetical protein JNB_12888 [Janibacter sp. HTCC2649]
MTMHTSVVSQEHLLRQAVLNTSQSIELLREAVSNSVDADARNIDIKLTNDNGEIWNIVIQDDGNGMEDQHMRAFFNAGQSVKDFTQQAIGEKGLGSKTSFVAKGILVESRRHSNPTVLLVGKMADPLTSLAGGSMPDYSIDVNPNGHLGSLSTKGTRIELSGVHLTSFNGKKTADGPEIAARVMHYLRSMCATGTVKSRHTQKAHILQNVMNVGTIPQVSLEVVTSTGTVNIGPLPGVYQVPNPDLAPTGGPLEEGIQRNSKKFCDVFDFSGSKTISVQGQSLTVNYDGTAIIAGDLVRQEMLRDELKAGWTQKSQMGVHLCKDFIPLRNNTSLSRDLLDDEYYYDFKLFLNCQDFQLNADRNVITNEESDEIAWIWADFKANVLPQIRARTTPYRQMRAAEDAAIEASKKTAQAASLKAGYSSASDITITKVGASLNFVKEPKKEADVSHLLAMMIQSGSWAPELTPIDKLGQYIDASTDILAEDSLGNVMLVEVENQLGNLFAHRHPMTSYDMVVVWSRGGMAHLSQANAPWGTNGSNVTVTLQQIPGSRWELKWGTNSKPVIVLSEII